MASNYYKNENIFSIDGYEVYFTRFADSIIKDHFSIAVGEIAEILNEFTMSPEQLMSAGGGLSSITQSLRDKLYDKGWNKINIESEYKVRNRVLTSESHEIDHYKEYEKGNIGLEIEWNNKDPFFDRDLENFRKLHQVGELTLGIIVTRGKSLQEVLLDVYIDYLKSKYPYNIKELSKTFSLSQKAESRMEKITEKEKDRSIQSIARDLCSSKYGTSTTHMDKLLQRLDRGVGDPCPLLLIGIGQERIV